MLSICQDVVQTVISPVMSNFYRLRFMTSRPFAFNEPEKFTVVARHFQKSEYNVTVVWFHKTSSKPTQLNWSNGDIPLLNEIFIMSHFLTIALVQFIVCINSKNIYRNLKEL